jgi:hypothetical protein
MSVPLFISERSKPRITRSQLSVGCLIFERMDQIDFTGPFEVLSRMPDTTIQIIGKEVAPVRDAQGLQLSPDAKEVTARKSRLGGIGQPSRVLRIMKAVSAPTSRLEMKNGGIPHLSQPENAGMPAFRPESSTALVRSYATHRPFRERRPR